MPEFELYVTTIYRVRRSIAVIVEATDIASAIEAQEESDDPDFADPGWMEDWDLQNSEVTSD